MTADTDIDDLLRMTAKGDRAAFRLLYDRTAPKLFGIAVKICRDTALAEDVMLATYGEIWHRAHRFDPRHAGASAWLAVIARHRAVEAVRRQDRGIIGGEADTAPDDPAMASDGSAAYLTLVDSLGRLDERQRDLILRAYYRGDSREDLARAFEMPVDTVRTWLRRGLLTLRTALDE